MLYSQLISPLSPQSRLYNESIITADKLQSIIVCRLRKGLFSCYEKVLLNRAENARKTYAVRKKHCQSRVRGQNLYFTDKHPSSPQWRKTNRRIFAFSLRMKTDNDDIFFIIDPFLSDKLLKSKEESTL